MNQKFYKTKLNKTKVTPENWILFPQSGKQLIAITGQKPTQEQKHKPNNKSF
jgi:hypothetical protein